MNAASSLPIAPPSASAAGLLPQRTQDELKAFLAEKKLLPALVELIDRLLMEKPDNVVGFVVDHLRETFPDRVASGSKENAVADAPVQPLPNHLTISFAKEDADASVVEADVVDLTAPGPVQPTSLANRRCSRDARRGSISAAPLTKEESSRPPLVFPKPEEEKAELRAILMNNWLTSSLDATQTGLIVDALSSVTFAPGQEIIKKGDVIADSWYIVASGSVTVSEDGVSSRECFPGDSFGELALLYNTPRNESVFAHPTSGCVCWTLDRVTFKRSVISSAKERRELHSSFLASVPILARLTERERNVLADALERQKFTRNQVVVTQGEVGNIFYLIEKGTAEVFHDGVSVDVLEAGGYFGEIALMNKDGKRATTVKASSDELCVLKVRRQVFERLLGKLAEDSLRGKVYNRSPVKTVAKTVIDNSFLALQLNQ